jgi:exonuclease VII large subunit
VLDARAGRAIAAADAAAAARLSVMTARLRAGDPSRPLAEGYVLVRDRGGAVVATAEAAAREPLLALEFTDGTISVRPDDGGKT